MLTLYRRHRKACGLEDRYYKRCKCPVWIEGVVHGKYHRNSLKTYSWQEGERLKRDLELGHLDVKLPTAIQRFLQDCETRQLSQQTIRKYRLLTARLASFSEQHELSLLTHLTTQRARDFYASWTIGPRTKQKHIERLRTFFKFCQENGWLQNNPAKALKPPRVKPNPTLPLSLEQLDKILAACPDNQTLAFVHLLRYSGLRISDASLLKKERLNGNKLFVYTQKTGTPVHLPLPDNLLSLLRRLPTRGGYFFIHESTKLHAASDRWRRKLNRVFKAAGVHAHPHQFRDTFAVELLKAGVPIENVSILLGHSSVKITEKHYSPWVKERQDILEQQVRRSWDLQPRLILRRLEGRLCPSTR